MLMVLCWWCVVDGDVVDDVVLMVAAEAEAEAEEAGGGRGRRDGARKTKNPHGCGEKVHLLVNFDCLLPRPASYECNFEHGHTYLNHFL